MFTLREVGPGEYYTLVICSLVLMITMVVSFMALELYYAAKGRLLHTYKLV